MMDLYSYLLVNTKLLCLICEKNGLKSELKIKIKNYYCLMNAEKG